MEIKIILTAVIVLVIKGLLFKIFRPTTITWLFPLAILEVGGLGTIIWYSIKLIWTM